MEIDTSTQIGADGERHPVGDAPTDPAVQRDIDINSRPVPVEIVGAGVTLEGTEVLIGAVELKDHDGNTRADIQQSTPATNAGGIAVREVPTDGTWADGAQTTVGGTAVQVLAANANRKSAVIQNVGDEAVRLGPTGVTATSGWVSLAAGAIFVLSQPYCPSVAVFAIREGGADGTVLASEIV